MLSKGKVTVNVPEQRTIIERHPLPIIGALVALGLGIWWLLTQKTNYWDKMVALTRASMKEILDFPVEKTHRVSIRRDHEWLMNWHKVNGTRLLVDAAEGVGGGVVAALGAYGGSETAGIGGGLVAADKIGAAGAVALADAYAVAYETWNAANTALEMVESVERELSLLAAVDEAILTQHAGSDIKAKWKAANDNYNTKGGWTNNLAIAAFLAGTTAAWLATKAVYTQWLGFYTLAEASGHALDWMHWTVPDLPLDVYEAPYVVIRRVRDWAKKQYRAKRRLWRTLKSWGIDVPAGVSTVSGMMTTTGVIVESLVDTLTGIVLWTPCANPTVNAVEGSWHPMNQTTVDLYANADGVTITNQTTIGGLQIVTLTPTYTHVLTGAELNALWDADPLSMYGDQVQHFASWLHAFCDRQDVEVARLRELWTSSNSFRLSHGQAINFYFEDYIRELMGRPA